MSAKTREVTIVSNELWAKPDCYRLKLQGEDLLAAAGQFFSLSIPSAASKLGRPFAAYESSERELQMIYQVVGEGTQLLAKMVPGSKVLCHGPFGRTVPMPEGKKTAALISGGVGIAPLLLVAKLLRKNNIAIELLAGFKDEVPDLTDFAELGMEIFAASESRDNDLPQYPTDYLINDRYDLVYCCGPRALMRVVANHDCLRRATTYLLLDERMACGVGVCRGCAIDTKRGRRTVCADGPAFLAEEINDL